MIKKDETTVAIVIVINQKNNVATTLLVTLDQATGDFTDTTNQVSIDAGVQIHAEYTQGDNSVVIKVISVRLKET